MHGIRPLDRSFDFDPHEMPFSIWPVVLRAVSQNLATSLPVRAWNGSVHLQGANDDVHKQLVERFSRRLLSHERQIRVQIAAVSVTSAGLTSGRMCEVVSYGDALAVTVVVLVGVDELAPQSGRAVSHDVRDTRAEGRVAADLLALVP